MWWHRNVDVSASLLEYLGHLLHAYVRCRALADLALSGVLAQLVGDLHGAELGAAHGAEVSRLSGLLRKRGVVKEACADRVQREIELVGPAELEARAGKRVITEVRHRMAFGEISGVRCDLVCDHALHQTRSSPFPKFRSYLSAPFNAAHQRHQRRRQKGALAGCEENTTG
jgi:hypothetical protein